MTNHVLKQIGEMESIFHGAFKRAGAELGVASFGMQVVDLPASSRSYPAHDHTHDGQEEVYVVLRGSAELEIDDLRVRLDPERIVRVSASARRKLLPGPDGVRALVIGGTPGRIYERPADFELGAPDPALAASREAS
jgi:mannose-6-phosphate isomerase-like protein (cupin superfamily)